jgi:hypothetical protein
VDRNKQSNTRREDAKMTTSGAEVLRHAKTYHGFTLGLKWFCIHAATLIVLLVTWFATPAGLAGGVVLAAIVYAGGIWAMNHGLEHSTESEDAEVNAAIRDGG